MNRKTKIFLAGVALVFAVCVWFLGIASNLDKNESVRIKRGASVGSVAAILEKRGMINDADVFKVIVLGFGGEIQAGNYDFMRGTSVWKMAEMLARGDIASTTIIIPEGLTTKQIVIELNKNGFLTGNACKAKCPADGELFPDTYRVAKGTSRAAVMDLMRGKMSEFQNAWQMSGGYAPAPLRSWNDIITLASIVQKETPKVSEMPIVASVYLNRLNTKMKLQADPTIVYFLTDKLGDMQGAPLLSSHLQLSSPYNTYRNYGLPPTPIANPGREAISAVLNPAKTSYLFFVADGAGGHNFSVDFAGHQENRKIWRQAKKK
ncbi:MAG: endolytic transglycosylase MltG [Rickettsiales bacterium]|jgi:UPF0755 protein|nr:endolytic transglycosylase MltG [Rickettsiales bacterium]